jgi:glycosyltransferase involved in cell wall biosynthesis
VRVLLIDQFGELGGAQRGLLEAAEGFDARGWELYGVVPEGPLAERLRPLCCTVTTIPCGPYQPVKKTLMDGARFVSQFRQQAAVIGGVIKARGIDVIYVNGPRVLPCAAFASRGRPLVFHSHSIVSQAGAVRLTGEALRWSNARVLASSQFVAGWLTPFVPTDRLSVIYNGIRTLERLPQVRSRHTRIGVLGRIAPEKGQLTFVRAARIAADADAELTFKIAGAPVFGSQDYFDQVRNEAGPRLSFLDWTENIVDFFDEIDLLVVPSEAVDANPRVIPEAYAAGVPVIAFDSGGISELLEHKQTGILVSERSSRSLASAMLAAVRDPTELNRLARNGHERWRERYTLPRFQFEVCDALERAVRLRAPAHKRRASVSA